MELTKFSDKLAAHGLYPLKPTPIEIIQVNFGKFCNQTCKHCHVDAGPTRTEVMTQETMKLCLQLIDSAPTNVPIHTVDITGGAPELNPNFRWFLEQIKLRKLKVMDRCNLTVILSNQKYHDLPEFFATHSVHLVASLPYYESNQTDAQRGNHVFERSIDALKMLNRVGYGNKAELVLDLVYNPVGAYLPAPQKELEADFKRALHDNHGIEFNNLYTITNMPIARFLDYLHKSGNYADYMEKLVNAFNPHAAHNVMCRNMLSVSWDGYLYDCDFNQMLDLKITNHAHGPMHLNDIDWECLSQRYVIVDQHCYGCTAGAGSSCGGSLT